MLRYKFIILLIIGFVFKSCSAQNLALHKKYTLSSPPNYGKVDQNFSKEVLTDGVYTWGLFWEQKTTLGWEGIKTIEIVVDLEKVENIGDVSFNTARRKQAGVYFPANIMVFISNDNHSFRYVGDATSKGDNLPGDYSIHKFSVTDINQSARYVMFKIVATQNNIFCDEIEILKGTKKISNSSFVISRSQLPVFINAQQKLEVMRKQLIEELNKNQNLRYSDQLDQEIDKYERKIKQPIINSELVSQVEKTIKNRLAKELNRKFGSTIIIQKSNPWQRIDTYTLPSKKTNFLFVKTIVPFSGVGYGAFTLTNTTLLNLRLKASYQGTNKLLLFETKPVATLENNKVTDALVPFSASGIDLQVGETKLIIFKIDGTKLGSEKAKIIFSDAIQNKAEVSVDVSVLGKLTSETSLSAVNWAYLNQPIIKNRQLMAIKDLEDHKINVVSVPGEYVPVLNAKNFSIVGNYLKSFNNVKKILIEMNYSQQKFRTSNTSGTFMSLSWKNEFKRWYQQLISSLNNQGYSETQVYLFPYDEVSGNNIQDLKLFTLWAHNTFKKIKIYSTLNNNDAIDQLTPLLDISQLLLANVDWTKNYKNSHNEVWIYDTQGFSRGLSPHNYYRLLAWKAYLHDFSGIGFWSYADVGQSNDNLYTGEYPSRDYAIIYTDIKGNIVSSRRWEAFKLGMQEYDVLKQYSIVFGIDAAKALAQKVVSNETDFDIADNVVQEMLNSLRK